jgi:hypothetical protein
MKQAADNRDAQRMAQAAYERDAATAEQQHIAASLQATKDLFGRRSIMYKTLTQLERVYGALQLANSAKAIVLDTINTAKAIANALARGAPTPPPARRRSSPSSARSPFPVVAAMVARSPRSA